MTNMPCQSDLAMDEWERLERRAEAMEERKAEIVRNAMEPGADWEWVRLAIVEDGRVDDLLDLILEMSLSGASARSAVVSIEAEFHRLVNEAVDQDFERLDAQVAGTRFAD